MWYRFPTEAASRGAPRRPFGAGGDDPTGRWYARRCYQQ